MVSLTKRPQDIGEHQIIQLTDIRSSAEWYYPFYTAKKKIYSIQAQAMLSPQSNNALSTRTCQLSNRKRVQRKRIKGKQKITKTYHLQSPHPPDPNLERPIHALHIVQLNPFPPTSPRRLPPEQQQLLRHSHRSGVRDPFAAFDVGP